MAHTRDEIFTHTCNVLVELFEVERETLDEDSLLYDDLDIDSIDTIDLMLELKRFINKDIDAQKFKDVRTVGDVVDVIDRIE
jgi:acyl carrier protein